VIVGEVGGGCESRNKGGNGVREEGMGEWGEGGRWRDVEWLSG
jgi:hypothetical protein